MEKDPTKKKTDEREPSEKELEDLKDFELDREIEDEDDFDDEED